MLKLDADEKKLHEQLAAAAADYARAAELDAQLKAAARGEGAGRERLAGRHGDRRGLTARPAGVPHESCSAHPREQSTTVRRASALGLGQAELRRPRRGRALDHPQSDQDHRDGADQGEARVEQRLEGQRRRRGEGRDRRGEQPPAGDAGPGQTAEDDERAEQPEQGHRADDRDARRAGDASRTGPARCRRRAPGRCAPVQKSNSTLPATVTRPSAAISAPTTVPIRPRRPRTSAGAASQASPIAMLP